MNILFHLHCEKKKLLVVTVTVADSSIFHQTAKTNLNELFLFVSSKIHFHMNQRTMTCNLLIT